MLPKFTPAFPLGRFVGVTDELIEEKAYVPSQQGEAEDVEAPDYFPWTSVVILGDLTEIVS